MTHHRRRTMLTAALQLAATVGLCLLVGLVGSLVTMPNLPGWYAGLAKPTWTPPDWLFGPVWTTLYCLMGVAAWLVWRRVGWSRPLAWFAVQLLLNAAWSWLFFGLHSPFAGLIDIVLLWAAIAATVLAFWRVSRLAAILMLPYWAWVSYAAALNFAIWQMNR